MASRRGSVRGWIAKASGGSVGLKVLRVSMCVRERSRGARRTRPPIATTPRTDFIHG
jgi:hypothetical protein